MSAQMHSVEASPPAARRMPLHSRWIAPALPLLAAVLVLAFDPQDYALKIATFVMLGALQASSLNIIWGFGGQFSMGQVTLSCVGAYASVLSVTLLGMDPWLSLLLALVVSAACTLVFGAVALRLRGFYFAVVTLAFAQLISLFLYNAEFTGGPSGMPVTYSIPDVAIGSHVLLHMDASGYLVVASTLLAAVLGLTVHVSRRRLGRAIVAVREEETLAQAVGIFPTRCKIIAFLMSSVPAALAGWMLAPLIAYVSPVGFGMEQLLDQICMVVIGGAGTVIGPLVGALVVVLIPELLRFAGALRIVGYSVVLILVVIFAREGLVGVLQRRLRGALPAPPPQLPERTGPARAPSRPAPVAGPHAPQGDRTAEPLLEVRSLTKRYSGLLAVSAVDLRIASGEAVGLIGPNGAGKTTLFDMVSGFTPPSEGQVVWMGRDISALAPQQRARLGMVRTFQHARVFPRLTTRENLQTATHLPPRGLLGASSSEERVARALALCHLEEWADTPAQQLPYGVGKRLGVALGLVTEPQLLMLDEPAAGLTQQERRALMDTLRTIASLGPALLVIEHDVEFVTGICPRIVVLSTGSVIADADAQGIRRDPAVIQAYLGTSGEAEATGAAHA
jgi:branched-chain amino acid transport system permease protein